MKIVSECGFSVGQNLSALYYKCWEARNAESLDEIFNLSLLQIRRRNLCCLLYTEMSFSKEKKKFSLSASDPGGGNTMSVSGNEQSLQDISEAVAAEGEISALPSWQVVQVVLVS